jgi:carboxyl-terminal processing protease
MRVTCLAVLSLLVVGCHREVAEAKPAAAPTEAPAAGSGPLTGIGIRPVLADKGFALGQVFPGGPAERAGLKVGDVVTSVDGDSSARWTLDRVAQRLRGPAGSNVALAVERGGIPMKVTIQREVLGVIPEVPR